MEQRVIEFFEPMKPPTITLQAKKVRGAGKGMFDDPRLLDAKAKLEAHFTQHRPDKPLCGALMLRLTICYPIKGKHRNAEPYTNKPDWDNAAKLIQDSLNALDFMGDDAQVVAAEVHQFWAEIPGIYVRLEEL